MWRFVSFQTANLRIKHTNSNRTIDYFFARVNIMYSTLAHLPSFFVSMTTYYCLSIEEALRRAKAAGKKPGCFYGGIVLKSGKRGFAIYREGKVIEQYSVMGKIG